MDLSNPVSIAVRLTVFAAGMAVFWRGQKLGLTPERIAGAIIAFAPIFLSNPSSLLGFVGGVGLGLWMLRRVS